MELDAVVVGLGVMGSAALWRLARRGLNVAGIEQFEPGHARGASHGQSRIIRTAYSEGAGYVPLVREAWRLWDELSSESGTPLVQRTGGLILAPASSAALDAPVASARAHGLDYEMLDTAAIRRRFPQHLVEDGTNAFHEADAGFVRAEPAVLAAVARARAHGARVVTGTAVARIAFPHVELADGSRLTARHIVVAAGAWHRRLLPPLASRIRVVRRLLAWFKPGDPGAYAPDRFPVFIRGDAAGERVWYGVPSVDGETVKLGVHFWPGEDEAVDPVQGARAPDARDSRHLAELIGGRLSGLDPVPVRVQACMYSLTGDGDFLVGPVDGLPGITVLGGFSGHGFKFAPIIGEIAADLATTGQTRWDIGFLSPDRSEVSNA
ncbi:MAG TPA: N-methyl-L-tryptophan oxidase [Candidatus Limnocylindrales bacterium]